MERLTTNAYQPKPRWERAQSPDYADVRTLASNRRTLAMYHKILNKVRTRLMPQYPELAYERDYTVETVENIPGAVHCFMTKTFYWYLLCDECDFFIICYNFSSCPFEDTIRAMLRPLNGTPFISLFWLQPNLPIAFKRTQRLEDSKFFKAW